MPVNLAAIDLKLLVVFDAVMAERNVTLAAQRLGMSQPAVSNALGRVRHLLKDQLFTRRADGMQPTPRAFELSGPVHDAMRKLEATLEPAAFDAASSDWTFKIAMSDHTTIVMLPLLLRHLKSAAPSVRLNVQPKDNDAVATMLSSGDFDLAIGVIPTLPRRFSRANLFSDSYVCMMRRDHPLGKRTFTLREYAVAEHLVLRPSHTRISGVDTLARAAGVQRNAALVINQFMSIPEILRRSDLITSLFSSIADCLDQEDLVIRKLPLPNAEVQVSAVWNQALTNHPAHRWLRTQLMDVGRQI